VVALANQGKWRQKTKKSDFTVALRGESVQRVSRNKTQMRVFALQKKFNLELKAT
jgi:hypothetical protein